jgi:putative ABC transport system permease protein
MRLLEWCRAAWGECRHRLGGRSLAKDLDHEVGTYVALLTDEKIAAGLSPDDARRAALLDVGGADAVREAIRDEQAVAVWRPLLQDVRYAGRLVTRAPALTGAIVLAMALGIGATAATFSAVDAVLLRPLPYVGADRLVVLLHGGTNPVTPANFYTWQRAATSFETMGAAEYWSPNLGGAGREGPEKLLALHVTPEILTMLGIAPTLGRLPAAGPEGTGEIVISAGLWRRRFNADPQIVGRIVELDSTPIVVVGVMPETFHFAPFWATQAELWGGFHPPVDRGGESLRIFAKLRPTVTLGTARAEMTSLTAALEAQAPGTNQNVTVTPLKDKVVGDVRATLLVLFGAVGCVLLIACANVAHLLLARASTREREFAVRCAIGASRRRVIRQLLTESLVLALAGGSVGVLLALGGLRIFTALGASSVPRLETMTLDGRVLLFATALAMLTGLLFGLAPARALARVDVTDGLRADGRGSTSARASRGTRRLLMASQTALALMLLVGAGLLLRSFVALRSVDPGFAPDRLASFVVSVAGTGESAPGRRGAFYDAVLERLRATPGVAAAAAINHMPLVGDIWGTPFFIEGHPVPRPNQGPSATFRVVSANYFETMGIRVTAGRGFTAADRDGSAPVIMVNTQLAVEAWPGESAVGHRLRVSLGADGDDRAWRTVIGVSANTVREDLHDAPAREVFLPLAQNHLYRTAADSHIAAMTFVVRATGDPAALLPVARATVRTLAPDVTISETFLMRDVVDRAADGARFTLVLLGTFAGVALVLAGLGVFGVMSHDVSTRRRELGIRLALGASRGRVATDVVRDGAVAAGLGLAIGFGGACALASQIRSLLFDVAPLDALTLATVTAGLGIVALAACLIPALSASRLNLVRELRD